MSPEELSQFMMYQWRECDPVIPPWDEYSPEAKADAIRVATKIFDKLASEKPALAESIALLDQQVRRLNSEVFATRITKHSDKLDQGTVRRQTLLGRVDELSGMAALGPVDQSFFLE